MVGIVIVSHSARLAEGVVELAREMAGDEVPIAAAGGLDEPGEPLGTDAARVVAAMQEVGDAADGGTLVLMDLGSAVLSAETALDFLDDEARARVRLLEAPLVEGAVAAAAAARAGASLDEAAAEARRGLAGKQAHLGAGAPDAVPADAPADEGGEAWLSATAVVGAEHGLHARPAAAVVRAAASLDAEVRLENVTAGRGPAGARSLTALSTLGALRGHTVRILARGPEAAEALAAVAALVAEDGGAAEPAAAADAGEGAPQPPAAGEELVGVAAAPGQAAGPALTPGAAAPPIPDAPAGPPGEERAALRAAREAVQADLRDLRASAAERAGAEAADILDAQLLLLGDEALLEASEAGIASGAPAARAWDDAVRAAARGYEALDDEYLRARATDLLDVGRRVLDRLAGAGPRDAAADGAAEAAILVAAEVGAADAAALDPERVAGMATAAGGPTSHAAIIARALGIPAVAGLGQRASWPWPRGRRCCWTATPGPSSSRPATRLAPPTGPGARRPSAARPPPGSGRASRR